MSAGNWKLNQVKVKLVLISLFIAGCGGGSGSPKAVTPPIVTPPPQPCTLTFSWTNPTHDVAEQPLDVDELKAATLYQFRIPMAAPEEADVIIDAGDPYTTMYTVNDVPPGDWWWTMTVSNLDADGNLQESGHSNELDKRC